MDHLPNPDAFNRARVTRMARVGMPEHYIAFAISVSINTLRKFYAELIRQAESILNLEILETLANLAKSGRYPSVTMFWAKMRCGFIPPNRFNPFPNAPKPEFVVRGPNGEREEDIRR